MQKKEGQGSSEAVANAGEADGEKRKSGGPEAAGNLPADKEFDKGAGKPVENQSGKQAYRKTANEIENGNEPAVPEEEGTKKRAGRPKQRLVSYSSQDSNSQDKSGSTKSTRKRTAMSKLGAVRIDALFRDEGNGEPVEKGRDTA